MKAHDTGERIIRASISGEAVSAPGMAAGAKRIERAQARTAVARRRLLSNLPLIFIYIFLAVMTVFAIFPIYFVVQASLAGDQNLYVTTLQLLPDRPTFSNYVYAFTQLPVFNWLVNTTIVCGLATLIGVAFSMTGAYALSRFRFKGREASLSLLLALQAFPGLLAITAYYYLLSYLKLLNTAPLLGLALIYAAGDLVFGTWNIKSYFDTIPVELEEAALIDGASLREAFLRITLPLATPALVASALFMFVGGWNEFALANFILNANANGSNLTFILGLYSLQGTYHTPWGYFAATSVIISVPLMLLFVYARRYFQSGLTIGGVKG
ncbi:MAG TPA: ABC transporter permease subunit [Ktedonobacteraceae bacterium]|nr:ABC transporter permease subunit [Ktedonobacteraceae bacterium]